MPDIITRRGLRRRLSALHCRLAARAARYPPSVAQGTIRVKLTAASDAGKGVPQMPTIMRFTATVPPGKNRVF